MEGIVSGFHIFVCVVLVLVVLVQSGRGADVSASFTGSSQSVFGASGGANFFTRFTAVTAALFMATSIYLTYQGGRAQTSLLEGERANTTTSAPAANNATGEKTEFPDTVEEKGPDGEPKNANAAAPESETKEMTPAEEQTEKTSEADE